MRTRARLGEARRRTTAAIDDLRGRGAVAAAVPVPDPPPGDPLAAAARRDADDFANMRRLLAFCLPPDANCIDVGSNRGAVLAEMVRVAPDGRHVAFEPIPHLCELLRERFPQVDVHQAALSDRPGESSFSYFHGDADGWSGLQFRPLPPGATAEVEEITVRLEVLDDVLDPEYRPALIKIDVEGGELQVLRGALETLRRHRPIVIFEHGSGSAEAYGTLPADVHRLLTEEAGLRIFDLDGQGPYTREELERVFFAAERVNFVARS